jgi:ABC-type sugar transport system ATPase subunit
MAMAFENYALYSHLTVFENIAFPLRAKRLPGGEVRRRVTEMAELLQISPLLERRPGFLSGGQRQRVALGRALVREADVYLLDEPISHLDAKLRHHMRGELKAMCARRQSTIVYVTHDYKEAMALSDRIAVLNHGRLMQVDVPEEVYHRPANSFVASYLGDPPMSFMNAQLKYGGGEKFLQAENLRILLDDAVYGKCKEASPSGKIEIGVRATDLEVSLTETERCFVQAEVYVLEKFGYRNIVTVRVGGGLVQAVAPPELPIDVNGSVWLNLDMWHVHLFDADGKAISHPSSFNGKTA